jgi:hypothetical protein
MTHKQIAQKFYFMIISVLLLVYGCDKSVDTKNEELDLSQITATGTESPNDFIGNIDLTDWAPSNYYTISFGKSFWIQRSSLSDTLYFGGLLQGDSSSQSLKIYNRGNTNLSVKLQLSAPFFAEHDSVIIQPSTLERITLYFILPDTTNTVFNGTVALQFSSQDTMKLKLRGTRVKPDTGGVVSILPTEFSLAPAYPNPTDGEIRFTFAVPQRIDAVLNVVNKNNEIVATVAQGNYAAGVHIVSWNANLANGNYRLIFQSGNYISKGDIQVLK